MTPANQVLEEYPAMLDVAHVEEYLGIGQKQAYELVHEENLAIRVRGRLKIPRRTLRAWIDDQVDQHRYV